MKVYETHFAYIPSVQKYQNVLLFLNEQEMSYQVKHRETFKRDITFYPP